MTRFCKQPAAKMMAFFLCLLIIPAILPAQTDGSRLQGPFNWTMKCFLEGKYRETASNSELLLSYFEDDESHEIKGKIYLLLGAANEKMGKKRKARQNYMMAQRISLEPDIDEIDFSDLVEYQRVFVANHPATMEQLNKKSPLPHPLQISPLPTGVGLTLASKNGKTQFSEHDKEKN